MEGLNLFSGLSLDKEEGLDDRNDLGRFILGFLLELLCCIID